MSANPFVGAWRLQSFEVRTAGGEISYPLGRDAIGLLLYGEQGYMAVSVMRADRGRLNAEDLWSANAEEKLAAFDSYNTYSGRYEVKDNMVVHHVELSLFPNWIGGSQERYFEFAGDRLTLCTPETTADGAKRTWIVVWQRTIAPGF